MKKENIYWLTLCVVAIIVAGLFVRSHQLDNVKPEKSGTDVHFNKTIELGGFHANDGAIIPMKVILTYDSIDYRQATTLKYSIMNAVSKECFKWTTPDILRDDSSFGTKIAMLINDGPRPRELLSVQVLQEYSDKDKYIDEHFSPSVATRLKAEVHISEKQLESCETFEESKEYKEALDKWKRYTNNKEHEESLKDNN